MLSCVSPSEVPTCHLAYGVVVRIGGLIHAEDSGWPLVSGGLAVP